FQAEDGIRYWSVTGVQTCALPISALLPDHEQDPRRHELDVALGALGLEEALQPVVAVALGRHGPELADDRHLGLDDRAVDLDVRSEERRVGKEGRSGGEPES